MGSENLPATVESGQDVVPWGADVPTLQALVQQIPGMVKAQWCSLVPATDAEKIAYFRAIDGETAGFDSIVNQTIHVENVLTQIVQVADKEGGEIRLACRTCLITPSGEVFAGLSRYILESVLHMHGQHPLPWRGGREAIVRRIPIADGRAKFRLEFVSKPAAAEAPKGKPNAKS